MGSHREVEHTYQPDADAAVPDLTGLPKVASTGTPVTTHLEAVYFDTPDQALLRAGVTLRRRTGGDDEGWHLKVPAGGGRHEVRLPLSRALHRPPKQLRDAVRGWTRAGALGEVATIVTERATTDLLDARGRVLAQLVDDRVQARPLLPEEQQPVEWREWELELVEGRPRLLTAGDELFAAAGVPLSATPVKLERAVGAPVPPHPPLARPKKGRPARLVVHTLLAAQVAELGRRESQVRHGRIDGSGGDDALRGVHQARVACRRLRGALATHRPLVDREVTDPIRSELRWLAHALGEPRDADVVQRRLRRLVEAEPDALVVGPVRQRLDRTLGPRRREALTTVRQVLDSERYLALREELDRLVAAPPWTDTAEADARDVLPRRVHQDFRRLRRRVRTARAATDPVAHDEAVHAVRRAAKRLRYAAEGLEPVWGKDAARLAKAAKRLSSQLGLRQDAVVARADLLAAADQAAAAGESTFTYGLLHAREQHLVDAVDREFDELWRRASRPALRSWT